jgi:hypothetical protein
MGLLGILVGLAMAEGFLLVGPSATAARGTGQTFTVKVSAEISSAAHRLKSKAWRRSSGVSPNQSPNSRRSRGLGRDRRRGG